MKFTVSKDIRNNKVMRNLLISFSTIMLLFLALDVTNKALRFGSTIVDIKNSWLGNENEFIEPLSTISALEMVHLDLFIAILLILLIGSIFMRINTKLKTPFLAITMLLSIVSFASFLAALFVSQTFVIISVTSFLAWHISASSMLIVSIFWLLQKP